MSTRIEGTLPVGTYVAYQLSAPGTTMAGTGLKIGVQDVRLGMMLQ
jgi:hypothetical protein